MKRWCQAVAVCCALGGAGIVGTACGPTDRPELGSSSFELGSATLVVSQVYGGGGNSGSTYKNDFIEIFNRGTTAVNVSGWFLQFASAGGSTLCETNLYGTIQTG